MKTANQNPAIILVSDLTWKDLRLSRSAMRKKLCASFVGFFLLVGFISAQPDQHAEARVIIDRAIEAIGGEAALSKFNALTWQSKGTYTFKGVTDYFISDWAIQGPTQYRKSKDYKGRKGQQFPTILVLDKDTGWFRNRAGGLVKFSSGQLNSLREENYIHWIALRFDLADRSFILSPLGKSQIGAHEVAGIKVAHHAHEDVELYFDTGTGLLARMVAKVKGASPEERVFSNYKESQGMKYAARVKWMTRYGDDLAVQEEERFEMRLHDKLDRSLFDRPDQ